MPPAVASPDVLSLPAAIQQALENNPSLAAQRRLRGIATARLVIADTYPFNPTLETRVQRASGPEVAGVTNKTPYEALLLWEVEVRGQIHHRRDGAVAALSRTEWEIVAQEQSIAVQVIKAYAGLQYRQEKIRLLTETMGIYDRMVTDVGGLVNAGKLKAADLVVARTEITATQDLLNASREAETTARQELLRSLGLVVGTFKTDGPFEPSAWDVDVKALDDIALNRRADLKARQFAVNEAAANVRLATANRYGNPIVGPVVGYDPSKIQTVGVQVNIPIPIANTGRGQMFQSEAEHAQAVALLKQAELNVRQDVTSALARLTAAEMRANQLRTKLLPDLQRAVDDMEKLFQAGEPGVDLLRIIDIRRKVLQARDNYIDALWSVWQARADVAAAVGEPALGLMPAEVKSEPPAKMGMPKQ
jgi:cobalt-zinc-cadmium efflux system outer membrane protein